MSDHYRFGIVAGEKSGDILGASLISALRNYFPNAEFIGVGGSEMVALGCESLCPIDRLSVMGFVEPLRRLPELLTLKRKLQRDGFFKIIKLKNTYEKPSEKKKRIQQENIKRVKKLNKLKNRI